MSRTVIDEIKERLDIVDVVGRYVTLQKAGRNYRALCPFHQEKTPSFYVFPDTGTWHCFGACGAGGDVLRFLEKREHLDFRDALALAAQMAGVELRRDADPETIQRENRLREINALAAAFYHHQLLSSEEGARARAYLDARAIEPKSIEQFQLGCAPDRWDALIGYLRQRNFALDDLEAAGLIIRRDDGRAYDRFRNRLIIPIRDAQGRVIGFGGRIMGEGEPKYLNTPQTALFDKSDVIFGLDMAKRAIRSRNQVILVEGYMDVISAHQRGFKNVVAAMGTAITPKQLKRLSRYAEEFVFAMDADAAGQAATLRSIHTARESLANHRVPVPTARGAMRYETRLSAVIKIAAMPPGKDPDDLLREDPEQWRDRIAQAVPLLEYYIAQAAQEADLETAHGKLKLVRNLLPVIAEIDDVVERRHYVGRLATLAGVTEREIDIELEAYQRNASRAQRRRTQTRPPKREEEPPPPDFDSLETEPSAQAPAARPAQGARVELERHVLVHLLTEPEMLAWVDGQLAQMHFPPISVDDFQDPTTRAIFDAYQQHLSGGPSEWQARLDTFEPTLQMYYNGLLSRVERLKELRFEQREKDLVDTILRLRSRHWRDACRRLEALIRQAEAEGAADNGLYAQLVHATREQQSIEKAIHARSRSSHWLQRK
ncbi:MAG: DNA primase [Chloroflexi bacterium]|nr:DNA primase [Chloroflexota bacterium]